MENASKALIMAAGVLIGILILSLAVFLFTDFGATSKGIYSQIEERQLAQFNAQYTVYSGRKDINIYDIVTLANLAKENNNYYKDYSDFDSNYKVMIVVCGNYYHDAPEDFLQEQIIYYSNIGDNGELISKFECYITAYHDNGRVKIVAFRNV